MDIACSVKVISSFSMFGKGACIALQDHSKGIRRTKNLEEGKRIFKYRVKINPYKESII